MFEMIKPDIEYDSEVSYKKYSTNININLYGLSCKNFLYAYLISLSANYANITCTGFMPLIDSSTFTMTMTPMSLCLSKT